MISLILPFWARQKATDASLKLMAEHYKGLPFLEIIVVDDGSSPPFEPPITPLYIVTVRMEPKNRPLNPCVPYNLGVEKARGDYIALSNPEILHTKPVLAEMRDSIKDDLDYVMAAAWCQEQNRWHCHSSMDRRNDNDVGAYLPQGSNYHFMTMMKRSLWDKAGGFDEDYRQGAAYDDPDFVRRLHRANAKFISRDDLVVEHPRSGAHAAWTPQMFARNRGIFLRKWKPL